MATFLEIAGEARRGINWEIVNGFRTDKTMDAEKRKIVRDNLRKLGYV